MQVLLGGVPVSSRKAVVTVTSPTKPAATVYVIARQGGNVTLNCTDEDGVGVTWSNNLGQRAGAGPRLPLIRVDRAQAGLYTCAVRGGRVRNVSLLVSHPPLLTAAPPRLPRPATALLQCTVRAVPVAAVAWYRISTPPRQPARIHSHAGTHINIQVQHHKETRTL